MLVNQKILAHLIVARGRVEQDRQRPERAQQQQGLLELARRHQVAQGQQQGRQHVAHGHHHAGDLAQAHAGVGWGFCRHGRRLLARTVEGYAGEPQLRASTRDVRGRRALRDHQRRLGDLGGAGSGRRNASKGHGVSRDLAQRHGGDHSCAESGGDYMLLRKFITRLRPGGRELNPGYTGVHGEIEAAQEAYAAYTRSHCSASFGVALTT